MKTIISIEDARTLGRPIGKVSDEKIHAFIIEVEQTIVRKVIGDELFSKLCADDIINNDYLVLLNGGAYVDGCGNFRMITGLKTAIAYYVYAQNVRAGDFESTRYGMVIKDGEYSTGITTKERDQAANNATTIADTFMKECLDYCKHKNIRVGNGNGNTHITSGCIIRKVRNV